MKKNKILLIDVGNTNIIIGFSTNDNNFNNITSLRFSTDKNATVDDFGIKLTFFLTNQNIDCREIELTLISSVVPEIEHILRESIQKYIKSKLTFFHELDTKNISNFITINYKNPDEIGSDRLVNAIAAAKFYTFPAIIVDIGTAATIDIINSKKEYIGGAILPGLGISANALAKTTSKLPKVDFKYVGNLIGKNTIESIQSGIFYGFLGSVKYFKLELKKQKQLKNAKMILTGGFTKIYEKHTNIFDILDGDLTLKGLKLICRQLLKEGKNVHKS